MCTVSVKVNVALLRGMRPELNTTAAIRQWAQQQIDLRIQQMETELGRNESQEDLSKTRICCLNHRRLWMMVVRL